jgi:hypothetical protein
MGTFSIRPNVSLNLNMSAEAIGGNTSRVYWNLQLNETAQQSSWNLTANNTASVSFSWWNGSTAPAIPNYTFDFRPTGLQNFVIGSGQFDVVHQGNGVGGTVTYHTGSIDLKYRVQNYDMNEWAISQSISGGIEIKRIFYEAPPAITRYFDP